MKTNYKQLFFALFVIMILAGCGQSTGNSASNNTDTINSNSSTSSVQNIENYCKKLDGNIFRYEYPFQDPNTDKPDTMGFTLMLHCKGDSLNAMMLGVDPEDEHGVYYYKSSLKNIRISGDSLSFSVVQGDLFEKPFTVENYNKNFPNKQLGGSNSEHFYTGKMVADSIVFLCSSNTNNCFSDTMVFYRKK
jgi:hypothetical protein